MHLVFTFDLDRAVNLDSREISIYRVKDGDREFAGSATLPGNQDSYEVILESDTLYEAELIDRRRNLDFIPARVRFSVKSASVDDRPRSGRIRLLSWAETTDG